MQKCVSVHLKNCTEMQFSGKIYENQKRENYTKKREKRRKSEIVNYKLKNQKIFVDKHKPL